MNSFSKNIGVSPKDDSIKTFRIKGEYLHIIYLKNTKSFIPLKGFRSYTAALKYGKELLNENTITEEEFLDLIEDSFEPMENFENFKSYFSN